MSRSGRIRHFGRVLISLTKPYSGAMLLTVVRVYHQGRNYPSASCAKPKALQATCARRSFRSREERSGQAVCLDGNKESLPPLIEPQLTGISPLALGLEGHEGARTQDGTVFYREGWWCRMRRHQQQRLTSLMASKKQKPRHAAG
jgi:hypothetical protein